MRAATGMKGTMTMRWRPGGRGQVALLLPSVWEHQQQQAAPTRFCKGKRANIERGGQKERKRRMPSRHVFLSTYQVAAASAGWDRVATTPTLAERKEGRKNSWRKPCTGCERFWHLGVDHAPSSPAFPFTPPLPLIINLLRPREPPPRISGERFWSRTTRKNTVASSSWSCTVFGSTVGFQYTTWVSLLSETLARSSSE
ncbi:hypothetical protein FN846DRAFT_187149 [Sphaerosporella brunnea]|uniref:Uncharacterized protein n=1 Tax=Sphaerosporella brunnea TaxID=1250544 RepID=A0A5J5EPN8_9PEZI|nr:hypothetical protein FN846DRAFT_187149 [Sphaerosporella brunnea]